MALRAAPSADQITLVWLLENKAYVAECMAVVVALSRLQVVVTVDGVRSAPQAVKFAESSALIEVNVKTT